MKRTKSKTSLVNSSEVFCFIRSTLIPLVLGFSFIGTLSLSSCNDREETPDWKTAPDSQEAEPENNFEIERIPHVTKPGTKPLRFVCYNLRNYLTMHRGKTKKFKPAHEVKALIDNILRSEPDVLGVCEIGNQKDLDHLLDELRKVGLDYKYSYLAVGSDPYRRQALLSHYPIRRHNVPNYTYMMKGKKMDIKRGILDATVSTPHGEIRFLGVHLKSKRPIAIYDQAEIRREEAQILRKHATAVLSDPTRKVLVFGDMNDTKGSATIRLLRGSKSKKLTAIELFDKHGTKWTQYWAREEIYSRFDFCFASPALLPMIDKKGSYILDTPKGCPASDHRALVLIIR